MKSFVTGATGFIGSAVVRRLLARDHEVRVLARQNANTSNIDSLEIEVIRGDLRDNTTLARCLEGMDCVFHLAADYRLWVPDPDIMFAVNVEATTALMRLCLEQGISRIIYTSSVATLGINSDESPADEDTPACLDDMIGPYKRSKYLAEQQVREMISRHQLPAILVYPSAPVGPFDIKPTPTGRTILDAAAGRMPVYVDTGLNIVHVDDVAEGHVLALEKGEVGDRFILGHENMTLKDILDVIEDLTGQAAAKICLPHKAILPIAHVAEAWARLTAGSTQITVDAIHMAEKKMFFSSAKAMQRLGYSPRPAKVAIQDAINWFKTNGYLK